MAVQNEKTVAIFRKLAEQFGNTVPNVYRTLAHNPVALEAFVRIEEILESDGRLSRAEQGLVALEVAVANECPYCQGVFSLEARNNDVAEECVEHVMARGLPEEPRFRAVVEAARRIMESRGQLGRAEITLFEDRGVSLEELLEITSIISAYTLATYANNLARTRIDPEFR